MTLKVIFISIVLSLFLAPVACSQSDVERIREINESAAVTPTATVGPTMTVAPPSPVPTATETSGQLSAELPATEVTEGDCINSTLPEGISIETVVIVVCSGPWEYRVLGLFEIDSQDGYPEKTLFASRASENCDRRYSVTLYPSQETWILGDRTVSCLQQSFGLSVVDPAKLDRLVGVTTVKLGECFDEALETGGVLIELVDCSGPWEYRVLGSFKVDDQDNFPGGDYFGGLAYENCDRRYSGHLYPSQETWILGDRTVSCLQESFGLSVVDPAKLDRLVGVTTVKLGECFDEALETGEVLIELIDCSGPWEYQVLESLKVDDHDNFPGDTYFEKLAYENCDRRYSFLFYPSQETWILGDRTVSCLQESFGLSVVDPAKLDRLVGVTTVKLGECFDEALGTGEVLIELVDCSGPWEYQVVKAFRVPWDGEYPGPDYFEQQGNKECGDSGYYSEPQHWTWDLGNRVVRCIKASNP